jgi:hypothetical protein
MSASSASTTGSTAAALHHGSGPGASMTGQS